MSPQKPQNNISDDTLNSFDSKQLAEILSAEKQILAKEGSIAATENYITKKYSFLNKVVMAVGFLTILSISLTGALIAQNIDNKGSQANAIYSCLTEETLVGNTCISESSSYPVYGEGCGTGYITMQSVCAKVVQKTCADFPEAVPAEAGLCKVKVDSVLLSEITDVDGRTCNTNTFNFKRYNIGYPLNSIDGPVVCASPFSAVFGKENFRFIPNVVVDITNFATSQTGTTTVPCLTGYTAINNNTQCSRPASIAGCSAGGEYLGFLNFFGTVKANAQTANPQTAQEILAGLAVSSSSISSLLISSSSSSSSSSSISSTLPAPTKTIAQLATSNTNLSTLVTALTKADLVNEVSGSNKLTVLAPTNEAFAKIPTATFNLLLKPENKETLSKILKYHVVGSEVRAADIVKLSEATTLEGSKINISVFNNTVNINSNVKVTATDVLATNGVVHLIDTVLIPSTVNLNNLKDTQAVSTTATTSFSCKVCPAGQYCPNNSTGATKVNVCANGGVLTGDKCIAQNRITSPTYTDGCSSEYVKLDQTCAIIEVRTRDLGCSYYYASDNVNVVAVLDGTRCSTGGRVDFADSSIIKVSDLQCDGADSAWYNYNVAYDPLVCGKGNPLSKSAFRWSVNSFTKITGLQKIASTGTVCPDSWIAINTNDCYQMVTVQEFKAKNDCPVNTYCPEGSIDPIACPANTSSPAKSTKLSDCVTQTSVNNGGGVIIISNATSSTSVSSSSVAVTVAPTLCVSKPGEYFVNNACVPCIAGYYCPGGNYGPIICPVGYYCPPASAAPTVCPVGTTTVGLGSRILDDCKAITKPAVTAVRSGGLQVFVSIFSVLSLLFFGYLYFSTKNSKSTMLSDWMKIK
jgi:uncharacterized surface protein with fasciclin (FAS1) repeats